MTSFRRPEQGNSVELDALGILRQTAPPRHLAWMSAEVKLFLLRLLGCGAEGLHKREAEKFRKRHEEDFLRLEIGEFISWERDRNGRPMFVALTWKGEEAAALLRVSAINESRAAAQARAVPASGG